MKKNNLKTEAEMIEWIEWLIDDMSKVSENSTYSDYGNNKINFIMHSLIALSCANIISRENERMLKSKAFKRHDELLNQLL